MSGINIGYEFVGGGEEIAYFDGQTDSQNLATIFASEIVNEIIENAIDIVTQSNKTGTHWNDIKESYNSVTTTSTISTTCDLKNFKNTQTEQKFDVVGDIVENIDNSHDLNRENENTSQIEEEMKKLVTESLSVPHHLSNGVGDQLDNENSQISTVESIIEPECTKTVGKKSRVTDLVKNSPQIVKQYLIMDEITKQNQDKWEESEEKVIQVIELECVKPGEEPFRVQKLIIPENIPLPDDDDSDELIEMPKDDIMDIIDLSSEVFKEEERQLCINEEHSCGAKGDDQNKDSCSSCIVNKPTEEINPLEEKSVSNCKPKDINVRSSKKKKWNFGSKLLGFFKRGHTQKN